MLEVYRSRNQASEYSHSSRTGNIRDGRNVPQQIISPSGKHAVYRRNTFHWSPLPKGHCSKKKKQTKQNKKEIKRALCSQTQHRRNWPSSKRARNWNDFSLQRIQGSFGGTAGTWRTTDTTLVVACYSFDPYHYMRFMSSIVI